MQIPLAFGHYEGRSGAANATEMVNMMLEVDAQGGAQPSTVIGTPGLEEFADSGQAREVRGGYCYPGVLLVVTKDDFYKIDTATGDRNRVGSIGTTSGNIYWAENPDEVMLIDGESGYVWDKEDEALTEITDEDFPTPKHCAWKDGFGVVIESSTGKMYVSAINDFTSWDALDFTTAEFEPDNLVGCYAAHDSLIALGEKTTQFYYNSGNSSYPFDNRQGANLQVGCGATGSIAGGENVVLWLDNLGRVRMLTGYAPERISTPQIEYQISQVTVENARGSYYTQEGHSFYVLTFPTEALTIVYDLTTGQWHRRKSYPYTDGADERYRANWIVQDDYDVFSGDYQNGKIYKLNPGHFYDNGNLIKWYVSTQDVKADQNMVSHQMLEVRIQPGVGLRTGQGDEPQMWMQYSDDGGYTWSHEKWASMGALGEYSKRLRWYNLGLSRNRMYRFGGTDPVKRHIISAHVEAEALGY